MSATKDLKELRRILRKQKFIVRKSSKSHYEIYKKVVDSETGETHLVRIFTMTCTTALNSTVTMAVVKLRQHGLVYKGR